jgi:hypothetical protein
MTIQNELCDMDGIKQVQADEDTRMVTVEWAEPATWDKIKTLLEEINYPPALGS